MKMGKRVYLDEVALRKIEEALRARFGSKVCMNHLLVVTSLWINLDTSMRIITNVNGGKVNVTVGNSVVEIQNKQWTRGHVQEAIAWIIGYAEGYGDK